MKRLGLILGLVVCGLLLFSPLVAAQNTTAGTAIAIGSDGNRAHFNLTTTGEAHWYWFWVTANRSYCAESIASDGAFTNTQVDTVVTVYSSDGATVIGTNDDSAEPRLGRGSRYCWIAPSTSFNYVKVTPYATPAANWYTMARVVETTQFCNWYFMSGDYDGFVLLKNTTNAAVTVKIMWKNPSGVTVSTLNTTIAAYATGFYSSKQYVGTAATYGSVEVAHTGGVGAIEGSITTLSGSTGLGFDAVFTPRRLY